MTSMFVAVFQDRAMCTTLYHVLSDTNLGEYITNLRYLQNRKYVCLRDPAIAR
jgi:hypothetical protein